MKITRLSFFTRFLKKMIIKIFLVGVVMKKSVLAFKTKKYVVMCLILGCFCTTVNAFAMNRDKVNEQEYYEIGLEVYQYFYPLVLMDITRRISINLPADSISGMGSKNAFHHARAFPSSDFKLVVRPNFDTLYSTAWLDLTKEPMVVSTPDTDGRYYMLAMLDMWTDVFAVPGKRTSGTNAADFIIVPPGWNGVLPKGMKKIEAPTPHVWIIGRTQTNGPKDYSTVHKIEDGYRITPLSQWAKGPSPMAEMIVESGVDMKTPPVVQINTMPAAQYYSYGAELMKQNPPHVTDWSIIARMERIGIVPGKSFNFEDASPEMKTALTQASKAGLELMEDKAAKLAPVINGWQMNTNTVGVFGNYYLKRAIVAMRGLGANPPEDAVYPVAIADSEGNALDGSRQYIIHFNKEELPPVEAFWSITMYDRDGFPIKNPLNRNAIGDRDDLKFNTDGSLDIYIQAKSPGSDHEPNWLPSPDQGTLGITMRLYAPKSSVLDGSWVPPAIQKVN